MIQVVAPLIFAAGLATQPACSGGVCVIQPAPVVVQATPVIVQSVAPVACVGTSCARRAKYHVRQRTTVRRGFWRWRQRSRVIAW